MLPQLQLLSPANVPAFADVVMLKLFHSEARNDHTLCGIGGDDLAVCPSLDGGYRMVRLEGLCHRQKREGMVPLRFYWSAEHADNAVTAAKKLRPSVKGYTLVRNVCYIWRNGGADTSVDGVWIVFNMASPQRSVGRLRVFATTRFGSDGNASHDDCA